VPFHFWLPGAMAAPTPVSAYLHSATMVKAGVFLLARLAPAMGGTETWHLWVGLAGAATMFYGAAAALAQRDLKRVLAFTTVSALGTLTLLLGIDTEESVKAAMVLLVVHALYKAALFLVVGTVDHETGTRDVSALGGLWRAMPWTTAAAAAAALSMAGWPPLLGFVAKELVYEAKVGAPQAPWILTTLGLAANVLVVASAGIVGWRPFFGAPRATPRPPHEGEPALVVGPLALAAAGVVLGLFPQTLAAPLLAPAIKAVHAEPTRVELALWHGINPTLLLSVATFALGGAVYAARRPIKKAFERLGAMARFGPERIYAFALAAVPVVGRMQTRAIQSGYLRRYVLATLAACIAVAAVPLFGRGLPHVPEDLATLLPHEVLLALVVVGGAVATAGARSRLVALGGLGAVGLGMALVFLLAGGPDLALTQIAVETLSVILFALVLYRLPPLRQLSSLASRARDAAIALGVGLFFTVLVWTAAAQPHRDDVARGLVARSFDEAKGRNVVNVILVDFRALDTLGEITVLTIAALGVVVLLRLRPEVERP